MVSSPDPTEPIIYAGEGAYAKLREMGIPAEVLVEAVQGAFTERLNAYPPFDPQTAQGTDTWRYAVRGVRSGLHENGWRIDDVQNLPLVISDDYKINITVSTGDEFTGLKYGRGPRSKNPKGRLIKESIARNIWQADLFSDRLSKSVQMFEQTLQYQMWLLMIYATDDAVRAELSRPDAMDGGYIVGWAERILIAIPLPSESVEDEISDEGPDIRPIVTQKNI